MPLTHVCMWSEHGWKRITASEATRLRPGGTVSARSGLFMCDICGQYVTLTSGYIRDPYFKHSSEEKSKDCPERTFGTVVTYDFSTNVHTLPIRIHILNNSTVKIEIGFMDIPTSVMGKRDSRKIVINGRGLQDGPFTYSLERLNRDSITYLYVGNIPAEKYCITYPIESSKLGSYWPSVAEGVSREGSLFDAISGKKLPEDADVIVNHPYYLVTTHNLLHISSYQNMNIKIVCQTSGDWYNRWNVYLVEARSLDEGPARFFLEYHARLTDQPVKLFPVWPEYIEMPYRILHKSQAIWLYMKGEGVKSKVFPYAYVYPYNLIDNASLLYFNCNERQQLVSSGRAKVLKYMYLWKDDFSGIRAEKKYADVKDVHGELFEPGEHLVTPDKGKIDVILPADGCIEVEDLDGYILNKCLVDANQVVTVENLQQNTKINIYCGLDKIWQASIIRKEQVEKKNDTDFIRKLDSFRGDEVPIPHALGGIVNNLSDRDELRAWIKCQIRKKRASGRALRMLIKEIYGGL